MHVVISLLVVIISLVQYGTQLLGKDIAKACLQKLSCLPSPPCLPCPLTSPEGPDAVCLSFQPMSYRTAQTRPRSRTGT